jgi:tetratricopeptide (TPR) repeat protein
MLFALLSGLNADNVSKQAGKVLVINGQVWLDAFGNNDFVEAIQGDWLYEKSVLKTGKESKAVIQLGQHQKTVPAQTSLSIKELLDVEVNEKDFKWFKDIKEILGATLDALLNGEESVALGSKGNDQAKNSSLFTLLEDNQTDIDALNAARLDMNEKQYAAALLSLGKITSSEKLGFYTGEYAYLKGVCYFQMSEYKKAQAALKSSYQSVQREINQKGFKPYFVMPLLFQLASSHYLLNEAPDAIDYFQKFLTLPEEHAYKPYAYLFLIHYYFDKNDKEKADSHITALKQYLEGKNERSKILGYLKDQTAEALLPRL